MPRARQLLIYLFSQPIISVKDASKLTTLSFRAAGELVSDLTNLDILQEKQDILAIDYLK